MGVQEEEEVRKPKSKTKNAYVSHAMQERVLNIIREHIGKPCPTNPQIEERLGTTKEHVQRALSFLCSRGILEREGSRLSRSYTIIQTGESTLPTKPKVCNQPAQYVTRNVTFRSAPMGDGVAYRDLDPDELDDHARAYLAFDASSMWPRHWPSRPIACKEAHRSPALVARLRSSSSHAS